MSQSHDKLSRRESDAAFKSDVLRILAEQKQVIGALAHSITILKRQIAELKIAAKPA